MSANLKSLQKKRETARRRAAYWQDSMTYAAKKLKEFNRKEKLYTTLIEKALEEQKQKPKNPTRVVEV